MLTKQDIVNSLKRLGIKEGDCIITHSSFKSLGAVEQGAKTIIDAMLETVGNDGTVVFPTLCQKDWENVYKNWSLDAPSDVGFLTNYFRKLPEAKRSNHATHSVAAIGKEAEYITNTHGESGLRYGIYGDTPFAADSPWEKMYELDAKVVFLGVNIKKCTFRHYAEYCFIEKCLKKIEGTPKYDVLKGRLWCYDRWSDSGVWPHINSEYIQEKLEERGQFSRTLCGEAGVMMVSSREFVDLAMSLAAKRDMAVFSENHRIWNVESLLNWLQEIEEV